MNENNIRNIFNMIDSDENHELDKNELKTFLNINENNIILSQIFEEVDSDGNGVISFDEFIHGLENLYK